MKPSIRNGWLLVNPNFRIRLADISAYERAGSNVHIHLHGVASARAISPIRKDSEPPEEAVIALLDLLDDALGLAEPAVTETVKPVPAPAPKAPKA